MKQKINFWDKVKNIFRVGVLDTDTKKVKDSDRNIHDLKDLNKVQKFKKK